jgi:hypothetical protein
MGSRLVRVNFTPRENEQIEAVIKIPEEQRSIIHGTVKDFRNKVVKDAVVKLFELLNPLDVFSIKPLYYAFTDECGQFLFGPLTPGKNYVIKVWINNVKIRELVIYPDSKQNSLHPKDNSSELDCMTDEDDENE